MDPILPKVFDNFRGVEYCPKENTQGLGRTSSFVRSFTHSFSPQIFTESLLGSRHCSSPRDTVVSMVQPMPSLSSCCSGETTVKLINFRL